jgi:23S rRNA U2552 (ribose-2'-O)-methylase RlmE/FtsJ
MPDASDVNKLQEQIFELVRNSQQAIIDAGRTFTERVSSLTPGDTAQIDDLIDNAFDMTERVLESQRDFAKKIVETVTSQIPGTDKDSTGGGDDAAED